MSGTPTPRTNAVEEDMAENCRLDGLKDFPAYAHGLLKHARQLEREVAELKKALQPFANFACDPPCECNNCKARMLLAAKESGVSP